MGMPSMCIGRIAVLCLLPAAALAAPLQETPRQLDQLKGLIGGGGQQKGQGGAANPLGALGGAGGLDKLLGQATGAAAKQNRRSRTRRQLDQLKGLVGGGQNGQAAGGIDGLIGQLTGGANKNQCI
ncbi:hypothetical protein AG1IA_00153 [Rhizoctonia solani AG-1 IA]|uniref:Uncharacterized protein n=1 Tax=Thanatephorus cucumeris (strain AG1-IA) TaxID=983506 RepID=L8X9Q9_THACA|nr:hypothetical protein AG1IA_00153 [Rhizoctonia solani AG-1 IA]